MPASNFFNISPIFKKVNPQIIKIIGHSLNTKEKSKLSKSKLFNIKEIPNEISKTPQKIIYAFISIPSFFVHYF